jgi:hypothetical protein
VSLCLLLIAQIKRSAINSRVKRPGGAAMKEALQSAFIIALWVAFWLAGTGGAVLQVRLVDVGVLSYTDPPVDHYDRF